LVDPPLLPDGSGYVYLDRGELEPLPLSGGTVATVPTKETRPGVVELSGSVMATSSPTLMLACCDASRAIVTTRRVEVILSQRARPEPASLPSG